MSHLSHHRARAATVAVSCRWLAGSPLRADAVAIAQTLLRMA